jgi:hypothetical protein
MLFDAVTHAWNSLSEPRAIKCIYIGMFAGTGGSGKWALAKMLRQALHEALDYDRTMPLGERCATIEDYHAAAMDFWAAQRVYHEAVFQKYADILNGEPGRHSPYPARVLLGGSAQPNKDPERVHEVIVGPWPALLHTVARG